MNRLIDWLLKIRVMSFEPGKAYTILYTQKSGLSRDGIYRAFERGNGAKDIVVFLQPCLDLDEVRVIENNTTYY